MDALLSHPLLPYAIGAVVLFVVYRQAAPYLNRANLVSRYEDLAGQYLGAGFRKAKLQKDVIRAKREGSFLLAGRLLEEAGDPEGAIAAYLEGEENWAAASVLEKMGPTRLERAADLYKQAGDHKKAAEVLVQAGKTARAAAIFEEKGNNLEAAQLYAQSGAWDKAAELFVKSGYPQRAAEAYDKLGAHAKAGQCYERHFMENVSYAGTYSSTAVSPDQKSALLAGQAYEKAGELERALQVYSRGAFHRQAAAIALKLGQPAKAAEYFLQVEDTVSAADALEKAGDKVRAANLRGEAAFKADRPAEAAAFFMAGQDYLRAAELYESTGLLAEAAASYEAADSPAAAGSVYLRAGLRDRAAAAYERAGEAETAAKLYEEAGQDAKAAPLYERAGQPFKAGEAALRAGEREKAAILLQRVRPEDENHRRATALLARLFADSGRPALAVARLQQELGGESPRDGNLDLCYALADGLEASGQAEQALALFKRIQAVDLQYQDVEARISALGQRLASGTAAAPPVEAPRPPAPARPAAPVPAPAPPAAAPPARPAVAAPRAPRFALKEEVGRGPLGAVFHAVDQANGQSVAMREMPVAVVADEAAFRALGADLKAAARVVHASLVRPLGVAEQGGKRYVVSEYVAGRCLAGPLRSGTRMSPGQALTLGRALAQALALVHAQGLVHGAVQPSNVMVAAGTIRLADLGLGRLAHALPRAEDYRAPEKLLDAAGDLHGLAASLYHLLTGVHPRSRPETTPPGQLVPGLPPALEELLLKGLHPDPGQRLASAEAVLATLKGIRA